MLERRPPWDIDVNCDACGRHIRINGKTKPRAEKHLLRLGWIISVNPKTKKRTHLCPKCVKKDKKATCQSPT